MAAKSFGQFGSFKWLGLDQSKNDDLLNLNNLSDHCKTNIKYFEKNFENPPVKPCDYTWEKPSEESPSFYKRHLIDDNPDDDRYKHTLELNNAVRGYPHVTDQNKWEDANCPAPEFKSEPQRRRYATLSTMTKYAEEMNKTFPGYSVF